MTEEELDGEEITNLSIEILHLRAEVQTLNRLYSILSEKYTALLQWQSAKVEEEKVGKGGQGPNCEDSAPRNETSPPKS